MAFRHLVLRFSPRLDGRWIIGLLVLLALILVGSLIRWTGPAAPLDLVALGPEGQFQDTLQVPASWADTVTHTPDAVARVPLILGIRNRGTRPVTPERLSLSLPLRYRLTGQEGQELEGRTEMGSPLITYTLRPGFPPIEPERLPAMLPAHDTLWLEVVIPSYYCVDVADSVPEFVPAPPAPVHTMRDVRIFYSFEGGDLRQRRTGTLGVRMDSSILAVDPPDPVPSYEMVNDPELARPELGALEQVGSRRSQCGEPGAAMELLSTVWETPSGGRFITIDYGGTVRKHLYDLDGDGVIERESWGTARDEEFTATRRTALPIPEFLLPVSTSAAYDMARLDTLPPDSLAALDPFRRAMPGPGALPGGALGPGADTARLTVRGGPGVVGRGEAGAAEPATADSFPEPRIEPVQPLGRPVEPDSVPLAPGAR